MKKGNGTARASIRCIGGEAVVIDGYTLYPNGLFMTARTWRRNMVSLVVRERRIDEEVR